MITVIGSLNMDLVVRTPKIPGRAKHWQALRFK